RRCYYHKVTQALLLWTAQTTLSNWCGRVIVKDRPALLRYAFAVTIAGLALALATAIPSRADPSHFSLFFLAVMLSSWYGGLAAGLVTTILAAVSLDYFFISSVNFIELDWRALLRVSVFTAIALVTSYLTTARKHAEQELRRAHRDLDRRVRDRTAELAHANDTLRAEIAERTRAENELLRLQLQLGRVERLATLGRMAGTIAHDLGTPLNSVLGYTQLLSQERLPEHARRRLTIIETQIHRMSDIIQRYLSHTRSAPMREKIQINDLVRDTLLLLQPVFQQRGVTATSKLTDPLPVLYGDGNSIQRVLINLLDNAVDACEGNGTITIMTAETSATPNKPGGVTIQVVDSGAGIPAEMLPQIFDLFMTTKPPGKGTGLGLVICQEIIRSHSGTIHISSQIGRGTTVTIYLPADTRPAVE
ncbi:MAG TPA: ATP-binding protein, partial [Terriglobales bacterium]|nr:ATP-binding protein [Terriglobales bacterium]